MRDTANRYYVYLHIRPDNRRPFYVGKGHGSRAFSFGVIRNQKWYRVYHELDGFVVDFLAKGLTGQDALILEAKAIAELGACLTNVQKPWFPSDRAEELWETYGLAFQQNTANVRVYRKRKS